MEDLDLTPSLESLEVGENYGENIYGAVDRRFTSAVYNQVIHLLWQVAFDTCVLPQISVLMHNMMAMENSISI